MRTPGKVTGESFFLYFVVCKKNMSDNFMSTKTSIAFLFCLLSFGSTFCQSQAEVDKDKRAFYQQVNEVYTLIKNGNEVKAHRSIDSLFDSNAVSFDDVIWGYLYNYKGQIFNHAGNYYLSKKCFQMASLYARRFQNPSLLTYTYNNFSVLLIESHDKTGTESLMSHIVVSDKKPVPDKLLLSLDLNLAYNSLNYKDTAQAGEILLKSFQYDKKVLKSDPIWINRNRLYGRYLQEIGEYEMSLAFLKKASQESELLNGFKHFQTALSYLRIGDYYSLIGKGDSALFYYEKTNQIFFQQHKDSTRVSLQYSYETVIIESLVKLGLALQAGNIDIPGAFENFKMAIGRINQLSHSITSETSRFIIAEKGRYCFDASIACAINFYKKTGDTKYLEQALSWSIEAKSLSLNQQFEQEQIYPMIGIPEDLTGKQRDLRRALDAYLGESLEKDLIVPLDTIITALKNYEKNERLIQSYYDKIRQVKDQNLLSPKELLRNMDDAIYFGYHELDSVIVLFKQEGTKLQYSCINKDESLLSDLAEFRKLISHTPINIYTSADVQQFSELGNSLYSRLIGPFLSQFQGRHLLIQSDGCLLGIPFEVLTREVTNSDSFRDLHYLIKDFAVQYVSTTMLTDHNHLFGKKDMLLITCRNSTGMPQADLEVTRLHDFYQKSLMCYIDDPGFKSNSLKLFNNRIHIASHAVINSPDPIQSGLSCSPDEPPLLKFNDILRLNLNGSHVFINGCQSGNGPLNHGEGLMSLGLAFALAGSSSVIQHLWTASDQSSMELGGLYYQKLHRLSDGDALQRAKKKYLKTSPFGLDHPYYWAGLVCFSGSTESPSHPAPFLFVMAILVSGIIIYRVARKRT